MAKDGPGRCKSYKFWSINQSKMLHWKVLPPNKWPAWSILSNPQFTDLASLISAKWTTFTQYFQWRQTTYANQMQSIQKTQGGAVRFCLQKVGWNANNYQFDNSKFYEQEKWCPRATRIPMLKTTTICHNSPTEALVSTLVVFGLAKWPRNVSTPVERPVLRCLVWWWNLRI